LPVLYVTEPGAVVRVSGESFVVTMDDDPDGPSGPLPETRNRLLEVEPHRIEAIVMIGGVHITSSAMHRSLDRGIDIAWLTRGGRLRGRAVSPSSRTADLRLKQYAAATEAATKLERARSVVSAKLRSAAEVLEDIQDNEPGNRELAAAIAELRRAAEEAAAADSVPSLLGIEGAGTRTFFSAYGQAFKGEITFQGRERRPPPDPANALLSFGYVLLGNHLAGLLEARGFDPCIGFFHELRPGRASLALDLLEELRHPVVDRFVLRSCNLRMLRPEHFEPDERRGGVRLTRDGMKRFFLEWEAHLRRPLREIGAAAGITPLELMRRQVEALAADLRGAQRYAPFLYGD